MLNIILMLGGGAFDVGLNPPLRLATICLVFVSTYVIIRNCCARLAPLSLSTQGQSQYAEHPTAISRFRSVKAQCYLEPPALGPSLDFRAPPPPHDNVVRLPVHTDALDLFPSWVRQPSFQSQCLGQVSF
jgi:hypothetical protein